jgi:Kef-type K+ transport system membrane component KefB
MFVPFLTLLLLFFLYYLIQRLKYYWYGDKLLSEYEKSKTRLFKLMLFNFIISQYEGFTLHSVISIILQLINLSTDTTLNTVSSFLVFIFIYYYFKFYSNIYLVINNKKDETKNEKLMFKYSIYVKNLKYDLHL